MFVHRQRSRAGERYPRQEAMRWLSWLADQLLRHNMTDFYIERMQPDWLPDANQQFFKKLQRLLGGLVGGLIFGLVFGLGGGLGGGLVGGLIVGLGGGLVVELVGALGVGLGGALGVGLVGGLVGALGAGLNSEELIIRPVEKVSWSPSAATI